MYTVYVIKHKSTGDIIYVGQTKRSLKIRFRGHVKQEHSAIHDLLRDNEDAYAIIPVDYAQTKQESFLKEEFWTRFFLRFYRLRNKSIGSHIPQETIEKLKKANKNKIISAETRQKISQANKGKKRSPEYIEEMKKRVSGKNNGGARQVMCIETGEIFDTIDDAQKKYRTLHISDCCNGDRKSSGKLNGKPLHWKFTDEKGIMQKSYAIYCIKCDSLPIYIGKTTFKNLDICLNRCANNVSSLIYNTIKTYGLEHFSIIKIDNALNNSDACEKELFWALFYSQNFNSQLKNEILESIKIKNTPRHLSEEHKKHIGEGIVNSTKPKKKRPREVIERTKATKRKKFELAHPKPKYEFTIYLLKYEKKNIYVGTTRDLTKELHKLSKKHKISEFINTHDKNKFELIEIDHTNDAIEALNKELFWKKFFLNVDDSEYVSYQDAGTKKARAKKLGVSHSKSHSQKISESNKGKNTGFNRYTSVMVINLFKDEIYIYGNFKKKERYSARVKEKMEKNINYKNNDGYIFAQNLGYDLAKEMLSNSNFEQFLAYIKKPHSRIDKRKIVYQGKTFDSITELSLFYKIDYAKIAVSITKDEGIFELVN